MTTRSTPLCSDWVCERVLAYKQRRAAEQEARAKRREAARVKRQFVAAWLADIGALREKV